MLVAAWPSVLGRESFKFLLFITLFLLLCHCVTRSSQVNHFLIGLQIICFYLLRLDVIIANGMISQSTLSVPISVNRNNEQMLPMYFRFACSRDIFRCNQLLCGTGPCFCFYYFAIALQGAQSR